MYGAALQPEQRPGPKAHGNPPSSRTRWGPTLSPHADLASSQTSWPTASGAVSWHPLRRPVAVPRPCQNERKTAVTSSHSLAPRTTPDLDFPRSAPSAKRTPKQVVTLRQPCVAEMGRIWIKAAPAALVCRRALPCEARPGASRVLTPMAASQISQEHPSCASWALQLDQPSMFNSQMTRNLRLTAVSYILGSPLY